MDLTKKLPWKVCRLRPWEGGGKEGREGGEGRGEGGGERERRREERE